MQRKKLKIVAVAYALILLLLSFTGCSSNDGESDSGAQVGAETCSVTFFDLGTSESMLLRFSDQKVMLIDCGGVEDSQELISSLKGIGISNLDYFVLTHPDSDHVGGAESILSNFSVSTLFIPKIFSNLLNLFPNYKNAITLAERQNIDIKTSNSSLAIENSDYQIAFLLPQEVGGKYAEFNSTFSPTATLIDDISAVIYVNIKGVRFLFTGDAGYSVEEELLINIDSGFYQGLLSADKKVDIKDIDFLKVAKGGKDGATGTDFVNLLRPKNAIVLTGENDSPSNLVITRLYYANANYQLYRTDVFGNIRVDIDGENSYKIVTDKTV